ncbi:MAG: prepilin-type N-terminal cleavage/methylation domain-containing protein [Pirellulaceae bacterium]
MHTSQRLTSHYQIRGRRGRSGFTLLEVLIATAVTLLMMVSLAKIFNILGNTMQQGRSVLELNNRLRSVTDRLRLDLDNLTAIPRPPANPASATGYLQYYDGSLTDFSAGQFSAQATVSAAGVEDLSRYGDLDDVLMFTAKAREGDAWFTGKVPLFVLQGARQNNVTPAPGNLGMVTIAAQHAEIAVFVEPVVTNFGNDARLPDPLFIDPTQFEPILNTGVANIAAFPAKCRLHYRTLLIRPDLNNASGQLPFGTVNGVDYLTAQQQFINTIALPTPTCDMVMPHRQCDLSIRRVDSVATATTSPVAANSLEDLVNPANRFAHVQIPLVNGALSMPILALSPRLGTTAQPFPATAYDPFNSSLISPMRYQSGFLHPAFTLAEDRAGEDVLASDILAFDIKGFDPSVPLLVSQGADLGPGMNNVDDDGLNGVDDAGELGWAGTDDILLTPNDPGYAAAVAGGTTPVGTGEYVDMGWGWKTRVHALATGINLTGTPNISGQLSGLINSTPLSGTPFTDAFYMSGLVVQEGAITLQNPPAILQPTYDTWTTSYEGDGFLQTEIVGRRGLMHITGTTGPTPLNTALRGTSGNYNVDIGTDGIDNNAGGVDDLSELETSPPFPVPLRGLRVSVRMGDPITREVKQMSVAKEFVTQ